MNFFRFCVTLLACCIFVLPAESAVKFSFEGKRDSRRGVDDALWAQGLVLAGAEVKGETAPLFLAGTVEVLDVLLAAGAQADFRDESGNSALHYVRDARCAQRLIAAGANVGARNDAWLTPIFTACDGDVAEVLLEAGAEVKPLLTGQTPLHTARDAKTVRLLVAAGAEVNARAGLNGYTPLCTVRDAGAVIALLEAGADARAKTENGLNPLHFPHEPEAVRALIAAGADVNGVYDGSGRSVLHFWASKKAQTRGLGYRHAIFYPDDMPPAVTAPEAQAAVVEMLIAAGADVNAVNAWNETPLMHACHPAVTRVLLSAGADANVQNLAGVSALHTARDAETVRLLLEAGARVYTLSVENLSPLHTAADEACVRLLLEAGADACQKNAEGRTPLWYAQNAQCVRLLAGAMKAAGRKPEEFLNEVTEDGTLLGLSLLDERRDRDVRDFEMEMHREVEPGKYVSPEMWEAFRREKEKYTVREFIRALVESGADVNAEDSGGERMIFHAWKRETVEMLRDFGAELACMDGEHRTALMMALHLGANLETARMFVDAGADVNAVMAWNYTALNCVSAYDTLGFQTFWRDNLAAYVKLLVDAGADVNLKAEERSPAEGWQELPALHHYRDTESVRRLLAAGADVNLMTLDERTPLYYCARSPEKTRLLLAAGANVNVQDRMGYSPLMVMAKEPWNVKLLLAAGAEVNTKSLSGETPLHYAVGNPESVKLMLAAGADVKARDNSGNTVLISIGMPPRSLELLLAAGAEVDARNAAGYTPLMAMVRGCMNPECVKLLLAAGADVGVRGNRDETLLHLADVREIMEFLVKRGLDVNARDVDENTPLLKQYAHAVAEVLLEAGADVNAKNAEGQTVMHILAAEDAHWDIPFYFAWGADVNVVDEKGRTPFFYAGSEKCMYLLLCAGADVKVRDNAGENILFREHGLSPRILRELVRRGVEVNVVNRDLNTPLHVHAGDAEKVRILLAAGANVHARDLNGETPLFYASRASRALMLAGGADPNVVNNAGERAEEGGFEDWGLEDMQEGTWLMNTVFDPEYNDAILLAEPYCKPRTPYLVWDAGRRCFVINY